MWVSGEKLTSSAQWCLGLKGGPVSECVRSDVTNLLAAYYGTVGIGDHVVDVGVLARLRRCRLEFARDLEKANGLIKPIKGGFHIRVRFPGYGLRHRRFTIAHEIVHTFFYNTFVDTPRYIKGPLDCKSEEDLCNLGAMSLLVPETLINFRDIDPGDFEFLEKIVSVSRRFDVSMEVSARRICELVRSSNEFGFCEWIGESAYLKSRKLTFRENKDYSPFVMSWLIPENRFIYMRDVRGTRLRSSGMLARFMEGEEIDPVGSKIQIGKNLFAKIQKLLVMERQQGVPSRLLLAIKDMTKEP